VSYADFLARKAVSDPASGLVSWPPLPEQMFPFQRDITEWALKRGRAALFAGTGLGKSFMELAWADAVHRETGKDILHLAPLAVSSQMVREADKFGIKARQVRDGGECLSGVNITNYQKLEHFDLSRFGGVILDESSILKSYDGHYRTALIQACARLPFRLAATATPAPNDFMELGNHAEFLGVMSYTDMLATFFTRDFRGEIVRLWQDCGWQFHSEVCIWKDPAAAQQRTKSMRLLHKQIVKDSSFSGQGLADYVVTFRKPGENPEPLAGGFTEWVGDDSLDISREAYAKQLKDHTGDRPPWPYETWVSILVWQRYASPVWTDIDQTRTLQHRGGRDAKDEVHISPLQLDVIERCIDLWSAPGDTVLTPFLGIGSEVYGAVEMGRKGIGIELKLSYFKQAVRNVAKAGVKSEALTLNVDHAT
jgi:hypothetical protein